MTWKIEENRLYAEDVDGALLAETTFPRPARVWSTSITPMWDESLRGQGIAGQMMETVVGILRQRGLKALASCPYAAAWMERHPGICRPDGRAGADAAQYPLRRPTASQKTGPAWCSHAGPRLSEPGRPI